MEDFKIKDSVGAESLLFTFLNHPDS